jgi:hypothetical protein
MKTSNSAAISRVEGRIARLEAALVSRERTRKAAVAGIRADRAELKRRRAELAALRG